MKRLKKWAYLLCMFGMGITYLSCVDHWEVYAKSMQQVRDLYSAYGVGDRRPGTPGGSQGIGWTPGQDNGRQDMSNQDMEGQTEETGGENTGHGTNGESGDSNESGDTGEDGDGEENSEQSGGNIILPCEDEKTEPSGSGDKENSHVSDGNGSEPEGMGEDPEAVGEGGDSHPGDMGESSGIEGMGEGSGDVDPENVEAGEPVYVSVEDDYFSDAVFIGDSRTVGMFEYGGLEETAAFYASKGLTIFEVFDASIVSVPGSKKKITVEEALKQNTFGKVYLMLGINEMGGNLNPFLEQYGAVIEHLKELQPDAIIYVQAIIKVTEKRSQQGDYITNEGIVERNEALAQFADNEKVFFLDVNPSICDDTGGMIETYTFDGVHLKAQYIDIWKDFLKSHAVSREE
jgi:hypothetical protein